MKIKQRIALFLTVLSIGLISLMACTPNTNENSNTNQSPIGNVDQTESNSNEGNTDQPAEDPVQLPSIAPTARPLVEENEEVPGTYYNNYYGVSLDYPTGWEILTESQTDYELLLLSNNDLPLYVYLTTYVLEEDIGMEAELTEYMEIMADNLSLPTAGTIDIAPDFQLNDELNVWRGTQQVSVNGGTYENIVFAYERGGRLFTLWFMGFEENHQGNQAEIQSIEDSFSFFFPSPYGVDRENAMFLSGGEPQTLDPAMHQGSADSYIGNLFSGLVRLDANLQLVPDLAERWDVSPDGKIYTFYLRQNVSFHDGRHFTAQDVKYSWDRAANPALESPTVSTYLSDIVGVDEVISGAATEISGIKVIDEYTIEVRLDAAKAYFLYKLAYPTSWIVDQATVDQIDEQPNGTGPFKLLKHEENEILIFARNEKYHLGMVPLEYLVYLLYQGPNIRLYEGGLIDIIGINEDLLSRAEDPNDPLYGNVQPNNNLCTTYVLLDMSMAPFEDPLVRKAFALAVDKERYNQVITEGRSVVANGLYPPGLPGFDPNTIPLAYNPEEAVEALVNSTYGSADNLPEIIFTTAGSGSGLHPDVALLIEMWQQVLGVSIVVEQIDPQSYRDQVLDGSHGQIISEGWCADYPDPENFADVLFHTGQKMNVSHFSNLEIDALLEQARGEADVAVRMALYHQIEQMLVDEVGAIFLNHSAAYYLVTKPYIQGYQATPIGIAQTMNIYIER